MNTHEIQRFRCGANRCLFRATDLINLQPSTNPLGRQGMYIGAGACPKCGGFYRQQSEHGPASVKQTYEPVGLKITLMPNVRCTARCMNATSFDCKCSCGGERHGIVEH